MGNAGSLLIEAAHRNNTKKITDIISSQGVFVVNYQDEV
jgi:hypothetical protein